MLYGGDPEFIDTVIKPLMTKIEVGRTDEGSFKYIGVNIKQYQSGICLNQEDYIRTLCPIELSKGRFNRRYDNLSTLEMEKYRALVGQLNWLATQSRPDISFCVLASKSKNANSVECINRANKNIKLVKKQEVSLHFRSVRNPKSLIIVLQRCFVC